MKRNIFAVDDSIRCIFTANKKRKLQLKQLQVKFFLNRFIFKYNVIVFCYKTFQKQSYYFDPLGHWYAKSFFMTFLKWFFSKQLFHFSLQCQNTKMQSVFHSLRKNLKRIEMFWLWFFLQISLSNKCSLRLKKVSLNLYLSWNLICPCWCQYYKRIIVFKR